MIILLMVTMLMLSMMALANDGDKLAMPLFLPVMMVGPTKFPSGYSATVAPRPSSSRVAPSSTADWIREQIRSWGRAVCSVQCAVCSVQCAVCSSVWAQQ